MIRQPPTSPLFPYTTLFRSSRSAPPDSNRFIGICTTRKWWSVPPASSAALSSQVTDVASGSSGAATTVFEETRSEEHTSELQSPCNLVCRLLLEKKKHTIQS